jgi:hypothetical protein
VKSAMTIFQLMSSQGFYGMESMMLTLARGLDALGIRSVVGVFEDGRQAHTEVGDMARSRGLPVEIIRCNGRFDVGAAAPSGTRPPLGDRAAHSWL